MDGRSGDAVRNDAETLEGVDRDQARERCEEEAPSDALQLREALDHAERRVVYDAHVAGNESQLVEAHEVLDNPVLDDEVARKHAQPPRVVPLIAGRDNVPAKVQAVGHRRVDAQVVRAEAEPARALGPRPVPEGVLAQLRRRHLPLRRLRARRAGAHHHQRRAQAPEDGSDERARAHQARARRGGPFFDALALAAAPAPCAGRERHALRALW